MVCSQTLGFVEDYIYIVVRKRVERWRGWGKRNYLLNSFCIKLKSFGFPFLYELVIFLRDDIEMKKVLIIFLITKGLGGINYSFLTRNYLLIILTIYSIMKKPFW